MNQELSRSFNQLQQAENPLEILNGVIACIHYQDTESEGEPTQIEHLSEFAPFEPVQIAHDRAGGLNYDTIRNMPIPRVRQMFEVEGPIYHTPELYQALDDISREVENLPEETVGEVEENHPALWQKSNTLFYARQFFTFGVFLIESFEERIKRIHRQWLEVRQHLPEMPHPLTPFAREWLPEVEPERPRKTGILHHAIGETHTAPQLPLTVIETMPGESEQLMLLTNLPQVELQLELPGFAFPESELVPALPLEAYETVGGKPSQSGGGARISQRLFCNILVEYGQKQRGLYRIARLNTNYRDVKSWLYPKGTNLPKSVLIPRLYKGMYELHNLRFLWERRAWNIISVDSLPTRDIRPDDPLTFTVRMPDGMNTTNGALIGIEPLRIYGAQSAPKFRAWVRLAYLWDKAKIPNGGKRIYATIPEVLRDSDNHLTDANGQKILTGELYSTREGWRFRQGNLPQTAWYHPLAIRTGRLIRNPQADKVPVLSDSDMVKLFYDHKERKGTILSSCLQVAKEKAKEMHEDGTIELESDQINEKTGVKGWRILEPHPSVERKLFTR